MRLFLVAMSLFILMGCTHYKCVQVLEIQYDDKGIFQEAMFYIGNLGPPILLFSGVVDDLNKVGCPPQKMLCLDPVNLKSGFYRVYMPDGRYMAGEGYGSTIYIRSIHGYSIF